jgi:hypothetical protein
MSDDDCALSSQKIKLTEDNSLELPRPSFDPGGWMHLRNNDRIAKLRQRAVDPTIVLETHRPHLEIRKSEDPVVENDGNFAAVTDQYAVRHRRST